MRNLKKALSLVLALVFVLGLCTIGAGAAFTDDAQIQYKEAITVLNGLGILEGYGDGKFGPLDNLTREQAAKMIAYMMLGEANAEKLINKQVFDDVAATRWSAKYIYFCYQKGIINGYGDGNFGPADNVTGTQLAKMLLCAAGYGCMGEYTGEGWDVNVFIDAVSEGIFEDANTLDYSAIATREEAALYVFNALTELDQVAYDVDLNKYVKNDGEGTFGSEVWKLVGTAEDEMVHVVTKNQATGADYTIIDGVNFAIETGKELIGHDVDIYFKADAKKDAEGETYYEAYLIEDVSKVVTVSMQFVGELAKEMGYPTTKFENITVWDNYAPTADAFTMGEYTTFAKTKEISTANNTYASQFLANNAQLILSKEGEILNYMTTSYTVDKVSAIEDGKIVLNNAGVFVAADVADDTDAVYVEAYEGIAKKDEVTLQPVGDVFYIYPTSKINVYISSISTFIFFKMYNYVYMAGPADDGTVATIATGNTYELSLDYYGSLYHAELRESGNGGYVLLKSIYTVEGKDNYGVAVETCYAQVVDSEGQIVIYPVYTATYDEDAGDYDYSELTTKQQNTLAKKTGVYLASVSDEGYVTLSNAPFSGTAVKSPKGFGKDATVAPGYYLEDSTKYFYVNGSKGTLEVDEASYFSTEANQQMYYYGVEDGSGYITSVVWIVEATAPVEVADSYIYVNSTDWTTLGYGILPYAMTDGSILVDKEVIPSYGVYVNGVRGTIYLDVAESDEGVADQFVTSWEYGSGVVFHGGMQQEVILQGFYRYVTDANNVTTLLKLDNNAEKAVVTKNFDLRNGLLTVAGAYDCDRVDISDLVVANLSGSVNKVTGYARVIDSMDDIEDLLQDGFEVEIAYVAAEDINDDWAPVGAIYVTYVSPEAVN